MEIVCSTDNNYVMPTGVMMCSLCENNRGEQVHFHVLSSDITDANKSALRRIADGYGKDIEFHKINDADLADFPIGRDGQSAHISSLATYYRLFLGDILPDSITKVIYLDGDLIVRKSLKELWDTDMDGYAIAGAPDTGNNGVEHYNRLLYPQLGLQVQKHSKCTLPRQHRSTVSQLPAKPPVLNHLPNQNEQKSRNPYG